jgi:hypothetical protein
MFRADHSMTIRRSDAGDLGSLALLAALDSAPKPAGPMLVAESDGRLLAAVPFGGGRAIADPFAPTAEAVALLELRARQIEVAADRGQKPAGLLRRLRARVA